MVCLGEGFGTFHISASPETSREREFCPSKIFTRAVLFFSSQVKTTGCCQVQRQWEYTYRECEGMRERKGELCGDLNSKVLHWALVANNKLRLNIKVYKMRNVMPK